MCSTVPTPTLLVEASKIWEVRRKSVGSLQEVRRNFFLNRYDTRLVVMAEFCWLIFERGGNFLLSPATA